MRKRRVIAALLGVALGIGGWVAALAQGAPPELETEAACGIRVSSFAYGTSQLGRPLTCTVLEPERYDRTILALFAIHGFEDAYDRDGQVLVDAAQALIAYAQQEGRLQSSRLMVVPCANPDGLAEGTTHNGFGRCNALGIDLNRDFDAAHKATTTARNYTSAPFSAVESQSIRDLVEEWQPDVVLDIHGWTNGTIGDAGLAEVFEQEMGLRLMHDFDEKCHGYFAYWAHMQGAQALLVELPEPDFDSALLLQAMERLMAGEYDSGGEPRAALHSDQSMLYCA